MPGLEPAPGSSKLLFARVTLFQILDETLIRNVR